MITSSQYNLKVGSRYNRALIFIVFLELAQILRVTYFLRKRDAAEFAQVDFSNTFSIVLLLISIFSILAIPSVNRTIRKTLKSPISYLVIYYLYAGVTAFWSSNLTLGLFRATEMIVHIFLIGAICQLAGTKRRAALVMLMVTSISILWALMWYWFVKGYAVFGVVHSNAYPAAAAMGAVFAIGSVMRYKNISSKSLYVFAFLLTLAVFIGTSSAANVSFLVGLMVVFMANKRQRLSLLKTTAICCLAWVAYILFESEIFKTLFPGKNMDQVLTARGRVGLWEIYIDGFLRKPLLGWGFPTGEKEANLFGWVVTSSAHNAVVSVAINTGLLGMLLFVWSWIMLLTPAIKSTFKNEPGSIVIVGTIVTGLLGSMSYPTIGSHWYWPSSILFFFILFGSFFVWDAENVRRRHYYSTLYRR